MMLSTSRRCCAGRQSVRRATGVDDLVSARRPEKESIALEFSKHVHGDVFAMGYIQLILVCVRLLRSDQSQVLPRWMETRAIEDYLLQLSHCVNIAHFDFEPPVRIDSYVFVLCVGADHWNALTHVADAFQLLGINSCRYLKYRFRTHSSRKTNIGS